MKILLLALSALLIRLGLSLTPGFEIDMAVWFAWADRLVKLGFGRFYDPLVWTHYTPGYLYLLYLLGKIKELLNLSPALTLQLFKLPNNLADIFSAWLIYKIVQKKNRGWALITVLAYLFNPALIFNSSVWGQADSFLIFLLLLAFYFVLAERQSFWSALFISLAILVKPQAIFALPVLLLILIKEYAFKKIILFAFAFLIFTFGLAWPFFPSKPASGLFGLIWQMGQDYPYITLNAFNFWQLLGNWQLDQILFVGLPLFGWGIFLFLLATLMILKNTHFNNSNYLNGKIYWASGLILMAFFLFLTRVHERYLLPALPFFLLAAGLNASVTLFLGYGLLTLLHFLNLYHVYSLYQPGGLFDSFSPPVIWFLSLLTVFWFLFFFIFFLKPTLLIKVDKFFLKLKKSLYLSFSPQGRRYKMIAYKIEKGEKIKNGKRYLILILIFAFLSRIILLWYPKAYIFDEVYHAFTAQEMLKGNIAAWEWWTTPPSGFAYEWTHPPLAKLIMVAGLFLGRVLGIGSDFFWWRLPAAFFGVAVIYLTYLLTKKIFLSEKIALWAAAFLSFEGLLLVMSRIGMADVYFLFFVLLTLILAWENHWFLSGISWGLALGTKWTGIYLTFPLLLLFAKNFLNRPWALSRWFGIMTLMFSVYFLTYLPFFLNGHSLKQWQELQLQMWSYHTNLKATHPYQSPALSWPLNLRPVWFYVNYQPQTTGNIYALGNPLFFWLGLLFLLPFGYETIIRGVKKMAFCLILYFIFWLPWIFSPRIMFLYHYLPSLPFLAMILAWSANYLQHLFKQRWLRGACLALVALGFAFLYPLWTGILLPQKLLPYFFWLPSWH